MSMMERHALIIPTFSSMAKSMKSRETISSESKKVLARRRCFVRIDERNGQKMNMNGDVGDMRQSTNV